MAKNWIIRGFCLALAALTLSGCIVVPEGRRHHPTYYWR
jgi:hypothetical protein